MPDIDKIPEVFYNALDPYHFEFDNLPLTNILERQRTINSQVDINAQILRDSEGSAGTLNARLNASLESDGSLKKAAVDDVLHNIATHEDGSIVISGEPVDFVRMLSDERDKLSLIEDEANNLNLEFETISTTVLFDTGTVKFEPSDTITIEVEAPNIIKLNSAFPSTAAHNHFYDLTPADATPATPDRKNYKTTTVATPFIEDSLRIYINGVRLTLSDSVFVPGSMGIEEDWLLTSYTSDFAAGTFSLNRSLEVADVIRIDFDTEFI